MKYEDDNTYIKETLSGNTFAFAKIMDKYNSFGITLAKKILIQHEIAEECLQDAYLKVFNHLHEFDQKSKFSTWFYSIIYNTAISIKRKKKIQTISIDDDTFDNDFDIPDESLNYLDQLSISENKELIDKALFKLDELDRTIIMLFYYNEQSISDISKITGLVEANIKTKLFRSRKKLKNLLSKDFN
jgi:RNA polymerase sigma factor (sigma-70 family)